MTRSVEFTGSLKVLETDPSRVDASATKARLAEAASNALALMREELPTDTQSDLEWFNSLNTITCPAKPDAPYTNYPDELERIRLTKRGRYSDSDRNNGQPIVVGMPCDRLYPYLQTDPWEYGELLGNIELREIIASTAFALLKDADTFTTIVGEDTSGRIPAIIIGKALNMVRATNNLQPARRLFMSGRIMDEQVPQFRANGPDDKVVFVTEYILTGGSVRRSLAALQRVGFSEPSVVTLDRSRNGCNDIVADTFYMGDRHSYTGRSDNHLCDISRMIKGVYKMDGDIHSRRVVDTFKERDIFIGTRQDIDHFAKEIVAMWELTNADSSEGNTSHDRI